MATRRHANSPGDLLGLVPEELLGLVRSRELELGRAITGGRHGAHRSRRPGSGHDFLEHRAYIPGDDLRQLDWRAVARRERLVVRRSESEEAFALALLFDDNAGMRYPGTPEGVSKLDVARAFGASLAHMAQRRRDPLAFVCSGDAGLDARAAEPSARLERKAALVDALDTMQGRERFDWRGALEAFAVGLRRPSSLVVFSDLIEPSFGPRASGEEEDPERAIEAILDALAAFAARGHIVTLVQTLHADELDFPWEGDEVLRFIDLQSQRPEIEATGGSLRARYLERFAAHLEAVHRHCERRGIVHLRAIAGRPLAPAFVELLDRLAARDASEGRGAGGGARR